MTVKRQATVLVVEDDPDLREMMAAVLEHGGYRVISAENGLKGLSAVGAEMPDVIVLDMKMPVMNGWEFAREFHARHDHLAPIVVVTAAEDARGRAEAIGAEAWVGKPFDTGTLLDTIGSCADDPGVPEISHPES